MPPFRDPRVFVSALLLSLISLIFVIKPPAALADEPTRMRLLPLASPGTETVAPNWGSPLAGTLQISKQFLRPTSDWGAGHRGIDLVIDRKMFLLAPHSGAISLVGPVFGVPTLTLQHDDGSSEVFQPVCALDGLVQGSAVALGERLAKHCTGSTKGHCDDLPCIHWAYRLSPGVYINPLRMLGLMSEARLLPSS